MLVLINKDNSEIEVYKEDGISVFGFDETEDLIKILGKQKVLYITGAIEATPDEILNTINQMYLSTIDGAEEEASQNTEKYLRSTITGVLHIEDVAITFNGPGDCKLVDGEMRQLIEESTIFQNLIRRGKISIIDYTTMVRESRRHNRQSVKKSQEIQSSRDKQLDSILIESSRPGSALSAAENMFDKDDGGLDITEEITNDPTEKMSKEQLSEALKNGELAP